MKKLLLFAAMLTAVPICQAQDELEVTLNTDLVSSYVWRGQTLDNVALQPCLNLSYKGFMLEGWASVGLQPLASGMTLFENPANEFDLLIGYNIGGLRVSLIDYYCAPFATTNYFKFDELHNVELGLEYDFGFLYVSASVYVFGELAELESGKKDYSPYAEISAPFTLGELEFKATVGASLMESTLYETDHFGVVDMNLTVSKDIELGSISIPAFLQMGINPNAKNSFIVLGMSF